jgi:hypothetical protein
LGKDFSVIVQILQILIGLLHSSQEAVTTQGVFIPRRVALMNTVLRCRGLQSFLLPSQDIFHFGIDPTIKNCPKNVFSFFLDNSFVVVFFTYSITILRTVFG